MKKITSVLIVFMLLLAFSLYAAGTPKTYGHKCILDNGSMPNVDNVGNTMNANYIVSLMVIGKILRMLKNLLNGC